MSLLLDLGIVALVVLFAVAGYKKGLIVALVNVAGTVIACAVSPLLSSALSTAVYTNLIQNEILEAVEKAAEGLPLNAENIEKAGEVLTKLPNSICNMLSFLGVKSEQLASEMDKTSLELPQLVESLVRPNAVRLISTILTVVLFILISVGLKYAAHLATKALEAVKLGNVNKLLGGVFGIAESAFIIMMATLLIYFVMMFMSPDACRYVDDRINETILYKMIYKYSMPDAIIRLFLPQ